MPDEKYNLLDAADKAICLIKNMTDEELILALEECDTTLACAIHDSVISC